MAPTMARWMMAAKAERATAAMTAWAATLAGASRAIGGDLVAGDGADNGNGDGVDDGTGAKSPFAAGK
eukprot:2818671-Pleurochrysis_carterae.AAC.1